MKFLLIALSAITVFLVTMALLLACGTNSQARNSSKVEKEKVTASGCGVERWSVKTLKDTAAREIIFQPITTTIQNLNLFYRPKSLTTRKNEEFHTYRVIGKLKKFKQEDDGDIHAIITDNGFTIIAELPNVRCTAGSFRRYQMYVARGNFQRLFGSPTGSWKYSGDPITIRGVGFFDFPHGQSGHSDNYIELHPVLGVK